jgi:lysyl-tRNA synthetase class 2
MNKTRWALGLKKKNLKVRAEILKRTRSFFHDRGYLEVETPARIPVNAPEPHIDPVLSEGWSLQTSPELAMKRMLAAGYDQIFQIARVWRSGERGRYHLPEFTLLEWYRTGIGYRGLMDECVHFFLSLVPQAKIHFHGVTIDLSPPWPVMSLEEAFAAFASSSLEASMEKGHFEEVLSQEVEPKLGFDKPLFLTDYPASMAALARIKPENPLVAERFELYCAGMELANAFTELVDPHEQRVRFESDEALRQSLSKPPQPLPEKFLQDLEVMPEAAGIAFGFDRLLLLLTDSETIDEVVAFCPEDL